MNPRVLISCHNLGYAAPSGTGISAVEKWDIRKLNLELHAGEKACFHFQNEEQKQVLWRMFQQKLKPKTGSLQISANTHLHTDDSLWEGTDKKASLLENMESKLFSTRPWFGGQRKNIDILKDRLGLTGRIINLPVNELMPEYAARFWALMLVAANTKVVLINRLLSQLDEISLPFIQEWQESFSGITVIFGEHPEYFKAVNSRKVEQQDTLKSFFSTNISFSADGLAKHF
jgi:ATPase subunit of ABC transporter with duplicated ATPase domains